MTTPTARVSPEPASAIGPAALRAEARRKRAEAQPPSLPYKIYDKAICGYLDGISFVCTKFSGLLNRIGLNIDSEILQLVTHVGVNILILNATTALGTAGMAIRVGIIALQCFDILTSEQSDIKNPDYQLKVALYAATTVTFTIASWATLHYEPPTTFASTVLQTITVAHGAFWSLSLAAAELVPDSFINFFHFLTPGKSNNN